MSANNSSNSFSWDSYIDSEADAEDAIAIKRVYIDMCGGNGTDALLFSQIMYWSRKRLRVEKNGHKWLVKKYSDWQAECGINARRARRVIERLKKMGLLITEVHKFGTETALHIRVNPAKFGELYLANKPETIGNDQNGQSQNDQNGQSGGGANDQNGQSLYTEITITENTKKIVDPSFHKLNPTLEQILVVVEDVSNVENISKLQRTKLTEWLTACIKIEDEFANPDELLEKPHKLTFTHLVKKGVLRRNKAGNVSTKIHKYKATTYYLTVTYGELGLTKNYAGKPVEANRQPFKEAVAAMWAWNLHGINWTEYLEGCEESDKNIFFTQVDNTLRSLEQSFDNVDAHQFQRFIVDWYGRWQKSPQTVKFTTKQESIALWFSAFRVKENLAKKAVS